MLTNTAPAPSHDDGQITAMTIAIEDAERRFLRALRDLARLLDSGAIGLSHAAELEAEVLARFTGHVRDLERDGVENLDASHRARLERRAARQRAALLVERRRHPRLRGLGPRERALRERQMCVVLGARVEHDLLRRPGVDDDEEALATRAELAAAGLL
jgi:hypothetical protein